MYDRMDTFSTDAGGASVLLVEDDAAVAQTMADALDAGAFRVSTAGTATEARRMLAHTRPDVIVLDLMLPDADGLVLCSTLRAQYTTPIVICSASADRRDRIVGLRLGADDFIGKPFDIDELEARLHAVVRRASRGRRPAMNSAVHRLPAKVRVGELSVDVAAKRVRVGNRSISLTPTEYRLLLALAREADRVVSRRELVTSIRGRYDPRTDRTLNLHVGRLRAKLVAASATAPNIVAIRSCGYKIIA
jgi:DNA-binding response OmpR family regulator